MKKQTGYTTMDHGLEHKPNLIISLDQCRRAVPYVDICPRCCTHAQLILGLKKTSPVCIDCAVDPTWTNPQENWGEGGVVVCKGQEFHGNIGASRIIVQHPKYTVFERLNGDKDLVILYNYSGKAYTLPRRNGKVISQMPNVPSCAPAEKTSKQDVGQLNRKTKTSFSELVHSNPRLVALLLDGQQEKSSWLAGSKKQVKPPGATIDNICTALQQAKNNEIKMDQCVQQKSCNISMSMCDNAMANSMEQNVNNSLHAHHKQATSSNFVTSSAQLNPAKSLQQQKAKQIGVDQENSYYPGKTDNAMVKSLRLHDTANLNDSRLAYNVHNLPFSGIFCCALTNHSQNNAVDVVNNCCVQSCGTNWTPNQNIFKIQGEGTPVYTQHAKLPMVGTIAEHAVPPERAVDWQLNVTQGNVHQIALSNQSNHKLSSCYSNSKFCYEFDQQNALPNVANSAELNRQPKYGNTWPYNDGQNNMPQSDEISSGKPLDDWYQTSVFCGNMANPMTLADPVIHKQQVETSKAMNWTCNITRQGNLMETQTLANQDLSNCLSSNCYHQFVNPQTVPQLATITAQGSSPEDPLDLTCKHAIYGQHDAGKPSNHESSYLYPYSLFNIDLAGGETLSTSTGRAKPPEEGLNMGTQENCTQTEPEKTSNQLVSRNCYPQSNDFLLGKLNMLVKTQEEAKRANKVTTQKNRKQVKRTKVSKVDILYPTLQPQLATFTTCVETPEQATVLTCKTSSQENCTQNGYPYSIFNLPSTRPLPTSTEQVKLVEKAKATNKADILHPTQQPQLAMLATHTEMPQQATILACKTSSQEKTQINKPSEIKIEKVNCNQVEKAKASNKVDILHPTQQLQLATLATHVETPQQATTLTCKISSQDNFTVMNRGEPRNLKNMDTSPLANTSRGKLLEFETMEDFKNAILARMFAAPKKASNTKISMEKHKGSGDGNDDGPCIEHKYPNISNPEFTSIPQYKETRKMTDVTRTTLVQSENNMSLTVLKKETVHQFEQSLEQDDDTRDAKCEIANEKGTKPRIQKAVSKQLTRKLKAKRARHYVDCEGVEDTGYGGNLSVENKGAVTEATLSKPDMSKGQQKEDESLNTTHSNSDMHCKTMVESIMQGGKDQIAPKVYTTDCPSIQKPVSKQLTRKQKLKRSRNDVDFAKEVSDIGFGGKQSVANEGVIEATQSKEDELLKASCNNSKQSKTSPESIMRREKNHIRPKVYTTYCPSSQIEANDQNMMDCADDFEKSQILSEHLVKEKEEQTATIQKVKSQTNIHGVITTVEAPPEQTKDDIENLRQDYQCRNNALRICKELRIELVDIALFLKRGGVFEDALGKADKICMTGQHESSYASKIVDLLVKQHQDWRDWSLEIDTESGLVLRNGKSVKSSESLPVYQDQEKCVEYLYRGRNFNKPHFSANPKNDTLPKKIGFRAKLKRQTTEVDHQAVAKKRRTQEQECSKSKMKRSRNRKDKGQGQKSAIRLEVSQLQKGLGLLQLKVSSIPKDLCKHPYSRKAGKSIQKGFWKSKPFLKKKRSKMDIKKNLLKNKAPSHIQKMQTHTKSKDPRHCNQKTGDNLAKSLHPKSVERSANTSSSKDYKTGMNTNKRISPKNDKNKHRKTKQVPNQTDKKKQWSRGQLSKRESSNECDKSKADTTMLSVKIPKDPKRKRTLDIRKCFLENLSKYVNARNVLSKKPKAKGYMETKTFLQQKNCSQMERRKKPIKKIDACHVRKIKSDTKKKDPRNYNQSKGDNLSHYLKPKKIQNSSKESSKKYYKAGMNPKRHIHNPINKKKKRIQEQGSKRENSNDHDKNKADRTMLSVKIPQDPKRQTTLQIRKCFQENVSKYVNPRNVVKPKQKGYRQTMKISKQESHPKIKKNEKTPTNMATCKDPTESKVSRHYNQDKANYVISDTANDDEETMLHQDLPQFSKDLEMFHLKNARSQKPSQDDASSNKDYKKGMNTKVRISLQDYKKKHQTQKHESQGERSYKNEMFHLKNARSQKPSQDDASSNKDYKKGMNTKVRISLQDYKKKHQTQKHESQGERSYKNEMFHLKNARSQKPSQDDASSNKDYKKGMNTKVRISLQDYKKKYQTQKHESQGEKKPAQDKFALSVNPKSINKSSTASSINAFKEVIIIPEQQIPIQIDIKKQGTQEYVSRSETSNINDNCKADRTTLSVKKPQNPEDLSKYEIARNVIEENINHTAENSEQESLPEMETKENLPTEMAACHVGNLQDHTESNYSMYYNQDDGNCVSNGTANDGNETILCQDLSQRSIALDMINLKYDVAHSVKPKRKQRSTNASSNHGKNTHKKNSHKKHQKKHRTQAKKNKGERSEHNSNNIALHLKRNGNKDVAYRKAHRKKLRRSIDPSIYHANIEFTNPEYIAMCEMIDNLIKEDKASQTSTMSLELPQDANSLNDQTFTKKTCTVPSQNESRYSESQVIKAEIRIPNQERKRDIANDYGKAQNVKRLSKPDHLLPKSYQRERHSKSQRHIHYHKRRKGGCHDADYHKASEFERDRERLLRRKNTRPYPDNTAREGNYDRSTNGVSYKHERSTKNKYDTTYDISNGKSHREDFKRNVRERSPMLRCQDDFNNSVKQRNTELPSRNHQKGSVHELTNSSRTITDTSMVTRQENHLPDLKIAETKEPQLQARMQRESIPQASMPYLATSTKEGRLLEEGGSNEINDAVNIQIHVFDRNNQRINPNRREESIYSWFELWIQIVPGNRQNSTQMQDDKLQQIAFLTGCTNSKLVFRECGYVTRSMKCKSPQVLSFTQRNNTLEITVYAYAHGGLWACVKEPSKVASYQREKYFIASDGQYNAENSTRHTVESERPGHQNSSATSRRQYWDARARIIRREHEAQNDHQKHQIISHPGNNFSRDGSYFGRKMTRDEDDEITQRPEWGTEGAMP